MITTIFWKSRPKLYTDTKNKQVFWQFEIKTDQQIDARRPDPLVANEKQIWQTVNFIVHSGHPVKQKK